MRLDARRFRRPAPYVGLAALAFVPLFLTKWGRIGADTKVYLYLDPGRLLTKAVSMWDPGVGMGTVTHQTIGYLFPMGPYYWLADQAGIPDWIAQRFWLGLCVFGAGAGVVYLLRTLGWKGAGVVVAAVAYMLSPYFLDYAAKHSVIALPWAGLPWLLAFTIRSVRHGGWRDPALFALTVQVVGGVNAPSLALVGVACLLWIPYVILVNRESDWGLAAKAVGRIGAITVITSLWWMVGLYAQSAYGIAILRFTETAQTVANASTAPEVLRGLGYWFFYGEDKYGNFVDVGNDYTQRLWLLALSFGIPLLAFAAAGLVRFRERAYFVALVLAGTILSVGAHPWTDPPLGGQVIQAVLKADIGLAIRSLPRAVPLIALGCAVFIGAAITAVAPRLPRPLAFAGIGLVILLLMANNPPLFDGDTLASGLSRPNDIPNYWYQDAAYLDSRGSGTRVLEVPGTDFASYRWGTTVDPVTPGIMDRPYVARELIPYGSPASADLLQSLDRQLQERVLQPQAVAPLARFMGVGDINVRSDLTYERYNLPRPRNLWAFLTGAPGLGTPTGFGGNAPNQPVPSLPLLDELALETPPGLPNPPKVAAIPVEDPVPIVRTSPEDRPVVLAGDGEGLIAASTAGLLTGHELVFYSATFAKKPAELQRIVDNDAALVLSDTNRRRARRWGTVESNTGATERPGQEPLAYDPGDQRLEIFPDSDDSSSTVVQQRGGVTATATRYGNPVSYTPENRAANAIDQSPDGGPDLQSAWLVGAFSPVVGERLQLDFAKPRTTDNIRFTQLLRGVRNRWISEVSLRFDGGDEVKVPLGLPSRDEGGEIVNFPKRTFNKLEITITGTDITEPGIDQGGIVRYDGISGVGFSDVQVGEDPPEIDEVIRLPEDLLKTVGKDSIDHALAIVLTRIRTEATNAVRSDEELNLVRTFDLPTLRSFAIQGEARLSGEASDDVIDNLLGLPGAAAGGVTATTSRRMPGDLTSRGSSTLDDDPSTWWSPGFLGQEGESIHVTVPQDITFDRLNLSVLHDGRHSVPTRMRIDRCSPTAPAGQCDGTPAATVDIPPVVDVSQPNAVASVPVQFPAVTGHDFEFVIEGTRDILTPDWHSEKPIVMPVGIAELGIPGVHVDRPTGPLDSACRSGLLTVDGRDIPVSLRGTVEDALARQPIDAVPCLPAGGLPLDAGSHLLRTAESGPTAISIDRLVLRSAAGGAADPAAGPLVPVQTIEPSPRAEVTHDGSTDVKVEVPDAAKPFWLVLGQSHNLGWKATVNGKDLGEPTLVDGYANGWLVRPGAAAGGGKTLDIHLQWAPQRIVLACLWLSVVGAVLCLGLILWPMRHRLAPVAADSRPPPLDPEPSRPRPFKASRLLRYAGARPRVKPSLVAVALSLVVFGAFISIPAGVIAAAATALTLRFRWARPLLTLGAPALLAATAIYIVYEQKTQRFPSGFEWPTYFSAVQQVAWMAVAFLVIDVVVDRLWLRRWWPTDESPS